MGNRSTFRVLGFLPLTIIALWHGTATAQLDADMSATENSNCDGSPCDYDGPSILINELMLSPSSNDGSMWGGSSGQRGEWIELYNPNICEEIDIGCFYLGNNASDGGNYPGGYAIPPGTVVPPAGFALIRGVNAPPVPAARLVQNGGNVVELVVDGTGVCVGGGSRLWFPNAGGWFAFYDADGVPQDAVSWANQSNLDEYPCTPTRAGCTFSGTLPNYNEFPNDRKNYILSVAASVHQGQSIRRIPDGGVWSGPAPPTFASCNAACEDPFTANCNGTATVIPQGGTPPYTYLWDDPREQTTQTADQLCAGTYCVTITDDLGQTVTECIEVSDVDFDVEVDAAICDGDSYTLPDNSTVTTAGSYPVLLHTDRGCDSLVTVHLDVHPIYNSTLTAEICDNQSYTLPDGTEVSTAGSYQVVLQSVHGCDSIYTVDLTVNPPVDVAVSAEICRGSTYVLPDGTPATDPGLYQVLMPGGSAACDTLYSIDLSYFPDFILNMDTVRDVSCFGMNDGEIRTNFGGANGPYTYTWSDGADHGTTATDLEPGTYSLTVVDAHGCATDTAFTISEPEPVALTATADGLICHGASSELNAAATGGTGDFEYRWSHTPINSGTLTVSPTQDAEYSVYATDENGCTTDTVELSVEVINMFADSLTVTGGDSLCAGESTSLSAVYSGEYPPYAYSWSHGLPATAGPHGVTPSATTIYTVTVTDQCGNEITKDIDVAVSPLPILDTETTDLSCHGADDGSALISVSSGTPGFEFVWSDGVSHGSHGTDLSAGNYSVWVIDAHGCEADTSFDIFEPPSLDIGLTGDTIICYGTEVHLMAQATGGTGDIVYHWQHTAADTFETAVSPDTDTEYHVHATDENGCSTDTIAHHVQVISMSSGLLTVTGDTAVCPGMPVALSGSYAGEYPPYEFEWTEGAGMGAGPHTVSPVASTSYVLTVTDTCGNTAMDTVAVGVFDVPVVELPDELIAGCSPLDLDLYDPLNDAEGYVHEWIIAPGATLTGNPVATQLHEPGLYEVSLVVTSPEGCSTLGTTTMPVEVYEVPVANFSASRWTTGIDEPEVTFTDISTGGIFSEWVFGGLVIEDQSEVTHIFADTGRYAVTLTVENEFGCSDGILKWVTVEIDHTVVIPNAFTPSDGGDDPYYDPESTSNTVFYPFSEYVVDYRMDIYNRWGELIFRSTEFEKGWNGTYRDRPAPQDVYVYKVELEYADGYRVTKVGDVTLFR